MRLVLALAAASVVRRAEQHAEVSIEAKGEAGGAAPRGVVTRADGSKVPFCQYHKIAQCNTECGATSLKGTDINLMQLGPKRCARCQWKRSTRNTFSPRRVGHDVADPDSPTCGPDGFSVEEGIYWGRAWEHCCYADVCFPEEMPCQDADAYRYGAYFGDQEPTGTTNHGPDGYVPPTRHHSGEDVGVNQAWRHVDRQAGVDQQTAPVFKMDPPEVVNARYPLPSRPKPAPSEDDETYGPCKLQAQLVDDCVGPLDAPKKTPEECEGLMQLFDKCLDENEAYFYGK